LARTSDNFSEKEEVDGLVEGTGAILKVMAGSSETFPLELLNFGHTFFDMTF
jgi:hypothetical protein